MKIGDKYKIHCYKHNGKIYQASEEAIILDIFDDYIVCGNNMVTVTETDGRSYKTKELAIIYFYKNSWFNIIAQLKKYGLFYYCNIATPYVIDGNVIKYIDYDLDLRVFPDGGYKILDNNEYKFHKKIMNYPEEIDLIVKNELSQLIKMKKNNAGPFNKDNVEYYHNKYNNLKEQGIPFIDDSFLKSVLQSYYNSEYCKIYQADLFSENITEKWNYYELCYEYFMCSRNRCFFI